MEHQKILTLLNEVKQTILNSRQENGTLSMIIQKQIMKKEMKLSIILTF